MACEIAANAREDNVASATSRRGRRSRVILPDAPSLTQYGVNAILDISSKSARPDASVAQLDRVLGYEPSGRRFESSRMHHLLLNNSEFVVSWPARVSQMPGRITLLQQRPEGRGFVESSSRIYPLRLSLPLCIDTLNNPQHRRQRQNPAITIK